MVTAPAAVAVEDRPTRWAVGDGRLFLGSEMTCKVPINYGGVGTVDVDVCWVRPASRVKGQARIEHVLSELVPTLTLFSDGHDFVFSFSSTSADQSGVTFTRRFPPANVLAVLIRHWVKTHNNDRLGLTWDLVSTAGRWRAVSYLGTEHEASLYIEGGPVPIFLAGLESGDESFIFAKNTLNLQRLINKIIFPPSATLVSTVSSEALMLPRVEPMAAQSLEGQWQPLVVWLYWDTAERVDADEEAIRYLRQAIAPSSVANAGDSRSDLVLLSFDEITPASQSPDGALALTSQVAVRSGDLVFAHGGFGWHDDFRKALRLAGVTIIDYSSKDVAWVDIVVPVLVGSPQLTVVRDRLLAYAERYRQRGATALVRRVLHRSVNRLAPLRIDLAVISELAEAGDRKEVLDQLRDMGTEWTSQCESHPLYCLAGLQSMLVGRVSGTEEPLKRFRLPLERVEPGDVILDRFQVPGSLTDEGRRLLSRLIDLAGLCKTDDGYAISDTSDALRYITAIAEDVQKVGLDSDGHELARLRDLADSLVDTARFIARLIPKRELFAERAGVQGFSYAAWLEEVAELLERLHEQAEVSEKALP
jgi:hypothetical protein